MLNNNVKHFLYTTREEKKSKINRSDLIDTRSRIQRSRLVLRFWFCMFTMRFDDDDGSNDEQYTLIWCWTAAIYDKKRAENTVKRWAKSIIICGPASIHRVRRNRVNVVESMRCHRDRNRAEKLCLYLLNALHTHTHTTEQSKKSNIWDLITLLLQSHQVLEMEFIFRHIAITSKNYGH